MRTWGSPLPSSSRRRQCSLAGCSWQISEGLFCQPETQDLSGACNSHVSSVMDKVITWEPMYLFRARRGICCRWWRRLWWHEILRGSARRGTVWQVPWSCLLHSKNLQPLLCSAWSQHHFVCEIPLLVFNISAVEATDTLLAARGLPAFKLLFRAHSCAGRSYNHQSSSRILQAKCF